MTAQRPFERVSRELESHLVGKNETSFQSYRPPTDRKDSSICLEDESEQCVFRRPGTGYSPDVIAEFCFNRGLSCDRFAAVERRPNNLGNAYCSIGIRHNTGRG